MVSPPPVSNTDNSPPKWTVSSARVIAISCAIGATLIGLIVLVGWAFHLPVLKSLSPDWVSMKANTAVAFLCSGLALLLLHLAPQLLPGQKTWMTRMASCLAGICCLIGLATLLQYFTERNLGIDELLFTEDLRAIHTTAPGRMAFNSAICFTLSGLCILTHSLAWVRVRYAQLLLLSPVLGLSLVSIRHSYLLKEVPLAIGDSLEGLDRVTKIVRAMKQFSHPGADEVIPSDLNRAIDSTLTVSRNEWKYVAEMITQYDPNLPLVPCLPGEFNQVILNLIVNAAHAIAEKVGDGSKEKGTITYLGLIGTRRRLRYSPPFK